MIAQVVASRSVVRDYVALTKPRIIPLLLVTALGGMFLKNEGWYEMGEGQRANYVEVWTWDPKAKKYRTWFFTDWGESGQGWATFDSDGNTIRMKAKIVDASGTSKRGQGTMTFADNDTLEWTWSESGPMGKMKFKGTSRRQR